jgi:hypothetical protein
VEKGINPPVPSYITGLTGRLQGLPGAIVTLDSDGPGRWLLRVTGERVTLEAHYDGGNGTGAWVTIDGKTSKFFGWEPEFTTLWHDPDLFRNGLVAVPPPGDAAVPAEVRHVAAVMRTRAHRDAVIGYDGLRWTVDVNFGDGVMRMVFWRSHKRWALDTHHPFQVIVGGEDLTAEAGGKMESAIKLLLAGSGGSGEAGASSVTASGAKANNAVTVHRASVIRN